MNKLNIRRQDRAGTLSEVEVLREFEVYGEKFFVHQNIDHRPFPDCIVSHVRTGVRVGFPQGVISAGSPESAEEFSREYIEEHGEESLKAAIAQTLAVYGPANGEGIKPAAVRKCRVCGCTEEEACLTADGPCFWVEWDLCSECHDRLVERLCRKDEPQ